MAGRIVEVLARHGVEYLLCGGIAAQLHGAARPTYDFDCCAKWDGDNLDRLTSAMLELGARLRVGGLTDEQAKALPVHVDRRQLFNMEISTWRTDAGDFDVLRTIPKLTYEQLLERAADLELDGIVVKTIALDDLIASKEWADRPKDHEALPELRALRDAEAQ